MYDEEKTLNFTTQNSFLHYGRKGMKWGKNIFGDDEPTNSNYGGTMRERAAYAYGKAAYNRAAKKEANRPINSTYDGSLRSKAAYAYGKAAYGATNAKNKAFETYGKAVYKTNVAKDKIKNSKPVQAYNNYFDEAIDAEIARKQAKNRDPEQKAKFDKMNSVSDETREQVRQVTSNLNELEKYINAYRQGVDSFDPSDKKKREAFAQKFIDKYGSKIREFVISANDGMDALENSGLEGFQNNKLEFSIKGKKGIDVMANLEKSVSSNQDQLKRKAKNVVYGDYK